MVVRRPQIHLSTSLVLMLVCGILLWLQFRPTIFIVSWAHLKQGTLVVHRVKYGWPATLLFRDVTVTPKLTDDVRKDLDADNFATSPALFKSPYLAGSDTHFIIPDGYEMIQTNYLWSSSTIYDVFTALAILLTVGVICETVLRTLARKSQPDVGD